jgi:hypothetical protein
MIMSDNDSRPTISIVVVVVVDDDCLVPIGITVPISIDDDCLVAIGTPISVSMDVYAARSYANANVVSQNWRHGANTRDGACQKCCSDHNGLLLASMNSLVNSPREAIVP